MALSDRTARESLLKRVGKYFSSLPRLALEENLLYLFNVLPMIKWLMLLKDIGIKIMLKNLIKNLFLMLNL